MAVYALAAMPLIARGQAVAEETTQCWFADDAGGGGKLKDLHTWWSVLKIDGPKYGYFVNPPKTWLVVKEIHLNSAQAMFFWFWNTNHHSGQTSVGSTPWIGRIPALIYAIEGGEVGIGHQKSGKHRKYVATISARGLYSRSLRRVAVYDKDYSTSVRSFGPT